MDETTGAILANTLQKTLIDLMTTLTTTLAKMGREIDNVDSIVRDIHTYQKADKEATKLLFTELQQVNKQLLLLKTDVDHFRDYQRSIHIRQMDKFKPTGRFQGDNT